VRIHIDEAKCQGHGRCYALAPDLVEADDLGNGREIGDGTVAPHQEQDARKAAQNCPEQAVLLDESGS